LKILKASFENNFGKKQLKHFFINGRSLKETERMTPG